MDRIVPALEHYWSSTAENPLISTSDSRQYYNEMDLIREVLFMLRGNQSFLFRFDQEHSCTVLCRPVLLMHLSPQAVETVLRCFASFGSELHALRE